MRPTIEVWCDEKLGDVSFKDNRSQPMNITYMVKVTVREEAGKFVGITENLGLQTVKRTEPVSSPAEALAGIFLALAYEEHPFLELVYKTQAGSMPDNAPWEKERQALCRAIGVDTDTPLSELLKKARGLIEDRQANERT
jgi:hypothetical protein